MDPMTFPEPQNELEHLLAKAAEDPSLHTRMWRMLWESELYAFIPDHPEMRGEFQPEEGDRITFTGYMHEGRPFIAVFTSKAAADWAVVRVPGPTPAIMALRGELLFTLANTGKTWVQVNCRQPRGFELTPEGVAALVRGDLTPAE